MTWAIQYDLRLDVHGLHGLFDAAAHGTVEEFAGDTGVRFELMLTPAQFQQLMDDMRDSPRRAVKATVHESASESAGWYARELSIVVREGDPCARVVRERTKEIT